MKLLLTGAWREAGEHIARLEALGCDVLFQQNESDPLISGARSVEGIVCNDLFRHHHINEFPLLRFIQLTSAGFDRVPMDEIRERGITIYNAVGVYSAPMAEYAVCAVLQFYKHTRFFAQNQEKHLWEKHRDLSELGGKTVCIVGCGNVGRECAKRFTAFDCRVIGVDLSPVASGYFSDIFPADRLKEAVATSDVIVLCLPLTDNTRHIIDQEIVSAMKQGAVLVNIARGGLIDVAALTSALTAHRIYAALDVFETEPLSADSPLWDMDNVLITPHNSFVGDSISERLSALVLRNLDNEQRSHQTTDGK